MQSSNERFKSVNFLNVSLFFNLTFHQLISVFKLHSVYYYQKFFLYNWLRKKNSMKKLLEALVWRYLIILNYVDYYVMSYNPRKSSNRMSLFPEALFG